MQEVRTKIWNYSRHPLNIDQQNCLRKLFPADSGEEDGYPIFGALEFSEPMQKHWKSGKEFFEDMNGKFAVCVVPGDILGEALWYASQADVSGMEIVNSITDESARKRGRFACRGMQRQWFGKKIPVPFL